MASLNKDTLILSSVVLAIEKDEDIAPLLAKEAETIKESAALVSRLADTLLQKYKDIEEFKVKYSAANIEQYIGEGVVEELISATDDFQNANPRDKATQASCLERLVTVADGCKNEYIKYSVYGAVVETVVNFNLFKHMMDTAARLNTILLETNIDNANYFKYPYQKLKIL